MTDEDRRKACTDISRTALEWFSLSAGAEAALRRGMPSVISVRLQGNPGFRFDAAWHSP